ncbi:right-handed parallel beta-helix repeat-containing protein [Mycetocola sp. JXN-3]|uniref:LPXTG cell wall anchor domain-containing protein n=1 Tax=Mycetocola sp. JXN-3 TaxID=2116510 RepID=UPI00165D1961|nr:right-handed parallel beta-helix repeat-containing protein [Mycetocola sp. JXN-3]
MTSPVIRRPLRAFAPAATLGAAALLIAAPLTAQALPSDTITVAAGDSIQAALNAAPAGATLQLAAGTFREDLRISKPVTIEGAAGRGTEIRSAGSTKTIDLTNVSDVALKHLSITGADSDAARPNATGIDANGARGLILEDIGVREFGKNGIAITNRYTPTSPVISGDITISNVQAQHNGWAGIAFYTKSSQNTTDNIDNVSFVGAANAFTDNAYNVQFGDSGNTAKVTGAQGGPVALGSITVGTAPAPVSDKAGILVLDTSAVTVAADATLALAQPRAIVAADLLPGVTVEAPVTTPEPTPTPTVEPTVEPTPEPTPTPTVEPTVQPTPTPTPSTQPSQTPAPTETPAAPAPAPAGNTNALLNLVKDLGLNVAATTASVQAAPGVDLTKLNPAAPFTATLPWSANDAFVDVYAYSTPTLLGSFPVVDGAVVVAGADLSKLPAGEHHIVFQGQTSKSVAVIAVAVTAAHPVAAGTPAALASTGADGVLGLGVAGGILLLIGAAALGLVRRRRSQADAA